MIHLKGRLSNEADSCGKSDRFSRGSGERIRGVFEKWEGMVRPESLGGFLDRSPGRRTIKNITKLNLIV